MADLFRALAAASLAGFLTARVAQIAVYDGGAGVVRIPSVSVGDNIFTQLALKDLGGLRFALQAATLESPAATPPLARLPASTVLRQS